MTTPDDKTLDDLVRLCRDEEYGTDLSESCADAITALRAELDALLRVVAAADAMRRYDSYRMPGEPHWQYDVARAALKEGK